MPIDALCEDGPGDLSLSVTGSGFRTADWEAELGILHKRAIPSNTQIFAQGDIATKVILVRGGLVKLIYDHVDGRAAIVGLRSVGWMLGIAAAIADEPHVTAAVAVTACEVSAVESSGMRSRARASAHLAWQLATLQSRETRNALVQVASLSCCSATERLESCLATITAELQCAEALTLLPLREWEIAQLISVTPQYLCRLMHDLQTRGRLTRKGTKWYVVPMRSIGDNSPPKRKFA
jgi:CRP-like cAMP-binding protein